MRVYFACFLFISFCLLGGTIGFAGDLSEIVLNDGSTVYGEIISLKDGVCTLRTKGLGTLKINRSEIRLIRMTSGDAPKQERTKPMKKESIPDLQTLQNTMLKDQNLMSAILSLQNDPQVQSILTDPAVMAAVNSGDIATLLSNPKFMEILSHPKIREIQKQVSK